MHKGNHHHKRQEQIHLRPLGGLRPVAQLMRGQKEHNLGELKRNTAPEPAGRDFSISHQRYFSLQSSPVSLPSPPLSSLGSLCPGPG